MLCARILNLRMGFEAQPTLLTGRFFLVGRVGECCVRGAGLSRSDVGGSAAGSADDFGAVCLPRQIELIETLSH
jgi:hypothetical protein